MLFFLFCFSSSLTISPRSLSSCPSRIVPVFFENFFLMRKDRIYNFYKKNKKTTQFLYVHDVLSWQRGSGSDLYTTKLYNYVWKNPCLNVYFLLQRFFSRQIRIASFTIYMSKQCIAALLFMNGILDGWKHDHCEFIDSKRFIFMKSLYNWFDV